ncbi:MAG: putative dual-specificity RNA methyltransferase RlmN [bacterium ADurb.Bin429]|nr:MAG: putative dual-specificity RNA methyltransferase RlmN [bacterium ADurb.Bin429]
MGCPFGCVFCATGQSGFVRNLTAAEIVDQVYRIQAVLPAGRRISNVVYMGMGEPLANYDAVVRSIRLLNHPLGLNLGQRRMTLSTVGIVPGIERLADEGLQVGLAISLHAPTQAARARIVPIAKKYPLEELLAAARRFVRRTGRKVTFEYTVVPGQNDADADADALAALVRGLQALVNVIPLNRTPGFNTAKGADLRAAADRFAHALRDRGVEAALRKSRGAEVGGACGQLKGAEGQ